MTTTTTTTTTATTAHASDDALWLFVAGELDASAEDELRAHLATCAACNERLQHEAALEHDLWRLDASMVSSPPSDLRAEVPSPPPSSPGSALAAMRVLTTDPVFQKSSKPDPSYRRALIAAAIVTGAFALFIGGLYAYAEYRGSRAYAEREQANLQRYRHAILEAARARDGKQWSLELGYATFASELLPDDPLAKQMAGEAQKHLDEPKPPLPTE